MELINVLEMKAVALAHGCLPASVVRAECRPDERQRLGCHLSQTSGRHNLSDSMSHGLRDHHVDRAAFGLLISEIHSREEEHSGQPAQPS